MKALLRTACGCTKVTDVPDGLPPPDVRIALMKPLNASLLSGDSFDALPNTTVIMRIFKLRDRYRVPGAPYDVPEYVEEL